MIRRSVSLLVIVFLSIPPTSAITTPNTTIVVGETSTPTSAIAAIDLATTIAQHSATTRTERTTIDQPTDQYKTPLWHPFTNTTGPVTIDHTDTPALMSHGPATTRYTEITLAPSGIRPIIPDSHDHDPPRPHTTISEHSITVTHTYTPGLTVHQPLPQHNDTILGIEDDTVELGTHKHHTTTANHTVKHHPYRITIIAATDDRVRLRTNTTNETHTLDNGETLSVQDLSITVETIFDSEQPVIDLTTDVQTQTLSEADPYPFDDHFTIETITTTENRVHAISLTNRIETAPLDEPPATDEIPPRTMDDPLPLPLETVTLTQETLTETETEAITLGETITYTDPYGITHTLDRDQLHTRSTVNLTRTKPGTIVVAPTPDHTVPVEIPQLDEQQSHTWTMNLSYAGLETAVTLPTTTTTTRQIDLGPATITLATTGTPDQVQVSSDPRSLETRFGGQLSHETLIDPRGTRWHTETLEDILTPPVTVQALQPGTIPVTDHNNRTIPLQIENHTIETIQTSTGTDRRLTLKTAYETTATTTLQTVAGTATISTFGTTTLGLHRLNTAQPAMTMTLDQTTGFGPPSSQTITTDGTTITIPTGTMAVTHHGTGQTGTMYFDELVIEKESNTTDTGTISIQDRQDTTVTIAIEAATGSQVNASLYFDGHSTDQLIGTYTLSGDRTGTVTLTLDTDHTQLQDPPSPQSVNHGPATIDLTGAITITETTRDSELTRTGDGTAQNQAASSHRIAIDPLEPAITSLAIRKDNQTAVTIGIDHIDAENTTTLQQDGLTTTLALEPHASLQTVNQTLSMTNTAPALETAYGQTYTSIETIPSLSLDNQDEQITATEEELSITHPAKSIDTIEETISPYGTRIFANGTILYPRTQRPVRYQLSRARPVTYHSIETRPRPRAIQAPQEPETIASDQLIVIGGPRANSLTAALASENKTYSRTTWDKHLTGHGLIQQIPDAFREEQDVVLIAGYTAEKTADAIETVRARNKPIMEDTEIMLE